MPCTQYYERGSRSLAKIGESTREHLFNSPAGLVGENHKDRHAIAVAFMRALKRGTDGQHK